jgi:hypothetical protein
LGIHDEETWDFALVNWGSRILLDAATAKKNVGGRGTGRRGRGGGEERGRRREEGGGRRVLGLHSCELGFPYFVGCHGGEKEGRRERNRKRRREEEEEEEEGRREEEEEG